MGKRSSKSIILIFAILVILQGIYFAVRFYNSTRIDVIDFEEVIVVAENQKSYPNSILIESIKVHAEIGENEGFLRFGGWVQNLNSEDLPLVISIHRFGFQFLHPDFDIHKTLYHVDKLNIGDSLVLFWEGERYEYFVSEIYEGYNNNPIGDNQILLYTCKYWNSDKRVFVVFSRF